MRAKKNDETTYKKKTMFIYIEYSLQIHQYYNVVQKILRYKSIQELSSSIISLPPMEMSASPTALQDNSYRAHGKDISWPTKEAIRDHVRPPATVELADTNRHHNQSLRLS